MSHPKNRRIVEEMVPESPRDWPIVAGDVAEIFADVERTPSLLRQRWAKVIWPPGNHEPWTHPQDAVQARGAARGPGPDMPGDRRAHPGGRVRRLAGRRRADHRRTSVPAR
ncbi:hypothetical protein AB0H94_33960 [Streptomyces purpurascens]|uniref:hypothetical protein n=1 Tax=Streptomyces purpurascens TaxID=1924 RepID=UPI0033C91A27